MAKRTHSTKTHNQAHNPVQTKRTRKLASTNKCRQPPTPPADAAAAGDGTGALSLATSLTHRWTRARGACLIKEESTLWRRRRLEPFSWSLTRTPTRNVENDATSCRVSWQPDPGGRCMAAGGEKWGSRGRLLLAASCDFGCVTWHEKQRSNAKHRATLVPWSQFPPQRSDSMGHPHLTLNVRTNELPVGVLHLPLDGAVASRDRRRFHLQENECWRRFWCQGKEVSCWFV